MVLSTLREELQMKVGDDVGRKYRQRFLKWDPISERFDRYGTIVLLVTALYLTGHLAYAYFAL